MLQCCDLIKQQRRNHSRIPKFALPLPITFLSSDEPLAVWLPHHIEHPLFQIRYVKGMARASTLLCLLDLIIDKGAEDKFPNLFASAAVIYATFEVHVDLASVAIY